MYSQYSQTPTRSRSGELTLSGMQVLFYCGMALFTTGLLTWACVHYVVFAR